MDDGQLETHYWLTATLQVGTFVCFDMIVPKEFTLLPIPSPPHLPSLEFSARHGARSKRSSSLTDGKVAG